MKTVFFLLSILSLINCDSNDNDEVTLIGKWKISQTLINDGSSNPAQWQNVENGHIIEFKNYNNFESNQFIDCSSGTYTNLNGVLKLNYSCDNSTIPNEFIIISLNSKELVLSNINCIEECKDKYIKQ